MVWILFCVQYCLAIIVLGVCLALFFALDLTNNSKNFQPHLEVYICLYVIGIVFFVAYHISVKTIFAYIKKSYQCFTYQLHNVSKKVSVCNKQEPNSKSTIEITKPAIVLKRKTTSGKFGLKLGVKTFVVVFMTVILVELITFVQQKLQEQKCRLTKKGLFFVTQLIYIAFQTHFVLTTQKEDIEKFSNLAYFGVAHSMATTVCTGFLLTAQDCLLKLYYYENRVHHIIESEHNDSTDLLSHLSSVHNGIASSIVASQNESIFFESDLIMNGTCSYKTYIDRIHDQIKPYSFHLCMMYVHCCAALLGLLMLHLRKKLHKPSSTTNFFTYPHPTTETFSAGAALSLIVLGIIISVLTITAEENMYVTVFLLFLHLQASGVGLFALYKISDVPCSRKISSSKNHAVFVIFYFFMTLSGVLKIITINIDRDSDEYVSKCLETTVEIVDLIQAFVTALLILIGFYARISPDILGKNKMPTKILIHLAATNLAAMISSVFNSKNEFSKFVDRLYKSANRDDNLFTSEIAWTVIESILVPCDEFYRFFTITCLIKLHKTWSPDEHSPPTHTRF